jgi:hypothetical protein
MRSRLRDFFVSKYLLRTDDVFEVARILLLYRFMLAFCIIFMLPVVADYSLGMYKALVLHSIDFALIVVMLFLLRPAWSLDGVTMFFFAVAFISNLLAFMMLNPERIDTTAVLWSTFFLALSLILLRGWARAVYCLFLGWLPLAYVMLNIRLQGALTIPALVERDMGESPILLSVIPIFLLVFAIWSNSSTIETARRTITGQKRQIEERNKEITDSIQYAKRIQQSLLPTEKYLDRLLRDKNE